MGNRSRRNTKDRKNKEKVVNVQNVSESKYVELHAEAYYRALKRIEMEKKRVIFSNLKKKRKLIGMKKFCLYLM